MDRNYEHAGNLALYGGTSGSIMILGMSLPEWAAIISGLVAVGGFVVSVWFGMKRNRREAELHKATLEALKHGQSAVNLGPHETPKGL